MNPPERPWENMVNGLGNSYVDINGPIGMGPPRRIPPLPPRRLPMNNGQMYGAARYNNYYSPYSNYGMGSGGFGFENRFVQLADENSQPAFQSVESFVRAFASVAMMMESTYHAVSMSFRAVLSAAENISRLKVYINGILYAIYKKIKFLYLKIAQLSGLVNKQEDTWRSLQTSESLQNSFDARSLFASFIFIAAPYVMYKLSKPVSLREVYVQAIALYDFTPNSTDELHFKKGDKIQIKITKDQNFKDWALGKKGKKQGLVPLNYIQIIKETKE